MLRTLRPCDFRIFEIPGTRVRLPLSQPYLYSQWVTLEQTRGRKHLLKVIFVFIGCRHRNVSACFKHYAWNGDSMIFEIPGTRVRLPLSQPYLYSLYITLEQMRGRKHLLTVIFFFIGCRHRTGCACFEHYGLAIQ